MVKTSFDASDYSMYTSVESKFNGQRNLEEMFACVWDLEEELQPSPPPLVPSIKSEEKAHKLRNHGHRFYKEKKLEMALSLYNMSIMVAPHPLLSKVSTSYAGPPEEEVDYLTLPRIDPARYGGTTEEGHTALAEGFASRSVVLFDLDLYEKCLRDINLAFEYGCPEVLRTELDERRSRCQLAMEGLNGEVLSNGTEKTEAESHIEPNGNHVDAESVNGNSSSDSSRSLEVDKYAHLKTLLMLSPKTPPVLGERNESVPSFSSAVRVTHSPSSGRGLVAVRYIHPGEVLAVERAYNVSLDAEELSTYCSTCLTICFTPLPCPGCSEVIFCSESCRQKGLAEEHWIECKILPTLIDMKVPATYYPHKLLKTLTHDRLVAILNRLRKEENGRPEHSGCNENGVYNSSSYQAVHHLCTNKEKFSSEFLFKQSKYAYLFTKFLQLSDRYFVNNDAKPIAHTREDYVTTGAVLLSHILMIHCNQFTISDQKKASQQIGSGLFLSASLVNHSCYQSTTRYTCGRDLVLVARRPIQAGEEVTGTYTKDFSKRPITARKILLMSYHIDCSCVACEHDWPTYDHLPKFRCIECKLVDSDTLEVCLDCRSKCLSLDSSNEMSSASIETTWKDIGQKVELGLNNVISVEQKLKSGECISEEDLKTVCCSIELAHKYMAMPCQSICSLESTLLGCFYAL